MYSKTTNSVLVTVIPEYNPEKSSPQKNIYIWSYKIHIENQGNDTIQLLNRHWKIVDSTGQMKEVIGEGVVGLQPIFEPGEQFGYSSETGLNTASGIMYGTYQMATIDGELFDIEIPAFSLDCPGIKGIMH